MPLNDSGFCSLNHGFWSGGLPKVHESHNSGHNTGPITAHFLDLTGGVQGARMATCPNANPTDQVKADDGSQIHGTLAVLQPKSVALQPVTQPPGGLEQN
uniref:Uncharacterized protein n=1 Tax=Eutreptiella gymnastica TaxID=73025 RepID=A0A7S4LM92_9EUGL